MLKPVHLDATSTLEIVRNIRLESGEFAAETYPDLTAFLDKVRSSEEAFLIAE